MNFKNQFLGIGTLMLIFFTSCQKDVVAPSETSQAAAVSSNLTAEDNIVETASPLTNAIVTDVNSNCAGYYEVLPSLYKLTTKTYPLILFIHGIGELGTGVGRLTCCGIPYWASKKLFPADFLVNGQHFSYVVMAPQFKQRPSPAEMQNCIDYAVKKYRVDPSRIYIAGLSMGGGSTWDYSAVYGQNVAAAVPVCGGSAPTSALAASIASKNLPVWTISSTSDAVVPVSWATNWVAWIKADNPLNAANVNMTTYTSGESHNTTWFKAFNPLTKENGINIYEWMLKYKRTGTGVITPTPTPAPVPTPTPLGTPTAKAGADITINKFWNYAPLLNATTSTIPGGWFIKASWTRISGPADAVIVNPAAFNTKVTLPSVGVYTFRVTLTTNKGVTATDDISITVIP
jgi:poly(3-hydroxybutyrate) depolymerase